MTRGVFRYLVAPLVCVGLLSGCRFDMFDRREPWRAEAEEQCIAEKGVTVSAYVAPDNAINRGVCGMDHPFRVTAFAEGTVEVKPRATLACPMVRDLNIWLENVVQPAALAWMGQPVVGIKQMSSYSCRGMNGNATARISEHAFGNALDIGAFTFADGRTITIKDNWRGPQDARGFLLQIQAGACEVFTTTLAPGSNIYHYDHIHVDLMRRAKRPVICQPAPKPMPPPVLMARQSGPFPQGGYPPGIAPPSGPAPLPAIAPPSGPGPFMGQRPEPASAPSNEPMGAPMDIMPHPPEQGMEDGEDAAAPGAPQAAPVYQPPQASAPPYASGPSYAPPRSYPPSGDPNQPVLMPPGAVPQPNVPRPPGPMSSVPPGWNVGAAPARSYASEAGAAGPFATGSITQRRYYSVPAPQPSTLPLPVAEPGED